MSDSFFPTIRGEIRLGRAFDRADEQAPSLVISDRLSRRAFAASPDVIGLYGHSEFHAGRRHLAGTGPRQLPFTIVGVVDRSFQFPSPANRCLDKCRFCANPGPSMLFVFADRAIEARRQHRPGGCADGAPQSPEERGESQRTPNQSPGVTTPALVQIVRSSPPMLFNAVALVLGVTCANAMNLLIAHNSGRAREMAVRLALGASGPQLIRQLVMNSGVLATIGGTAGIAIAIPRVETLSRLQTVDVLLLDAVHVDGAGVFLFTYTVVALTTLLRAIIPTLQSSSLKRCGQAASALHTASADDASVAH